MTEANAPRRARNALYRLGCVVVLLILVVGGLQNAAGHRWPKTVATAPAAPRLHPDYAGVTLPPNLAPLNFAVNEPGDAVRVRLTAGKVHWIGAARRGSVRIPLKIWRGLMKAGRGGDLTIDVAVHTKTGWTRYPSVVNHIASDPIDPFLFYRKFRPSYTSHVSLGIYERDLRTYRERKLIANDDIGGQCVNCHTFCNYNPNQWFFHTRHPNGETAMVVVRGGKAQAVDTRTAERKAPAGYAVWRPDGKAIAFAHNFIRQYFREEGTCARDALDSRAGLALWFAADGHTEAPKELNPAGWLPTFPAWSPDGKYLYYCRCRQTWDAKDTMPLAAQPALRYDLVRNSYDAAKNKWGAVETVLSAADAAASVMEPRVSPDGHWLLCALNPYGTFPAFQRQSDLYLLDLTKPDTPPRRLFASDKAASDANSGALDDSWRDCYHAWSSNSRWLIFARRSDNGMYARPYLCYVDAKGQPGKPLIVPQADPHFYDGYLKTYNVPELAKGPVSATTRELIRAAMKGAQGHKAEVGTEKDATPATNAVN